MNEAEALLGYARSDWLVFGRWDRLHAAVSLVPDADESGYEDVVTACGLRRARASIPGVLTRLCAPRCAHCCDATGLPRGVGSPKNGAACRKLLGIGAAS